MKKVGIATFHFADNYGAVLQCFALQKVINSFEGVNAEVIDYRPHGFRYAKVWNNEKEKILFYQKRKLFEKFLREYCNLSQQRVEHISGYGYDYCCVGSDQVWNVADSYFEEYFFPNLLPEVCKISYAPSIGCSVRDMEPYVMIYSKFLSSFKEISIREIEHREYLSKICGKECSCVLDPTLLLDRESYFPVVQEPEESIEAPYLLFYWLHYDREFYQGIELANMIARRYNLRIIHSIIGKNKNFIFNEEKCIYYVGIEEFLWYVKNASFIVTNSYHGTIFSLQFEIPFYSFVIKSMRSRFDTLLEYVDIKERIVDRMLTCNEIDADIDFKKNKQSICQYKEQSIEYLKSALDLL